MRPLIGGFKKKIERAEFQPGKPVTPPRWLLIVPLSLILLSGVLLAAWRNWARVYSAGAVWGWLTQSKMYKTEVALLFLDGRGWCLESRNVQK